MTKYELSNVGKGVNFTRTHIVEQIKSFCVFLILFSSNTKIERQKEEDDEGRVFCSPRLSLGNQVDGLPSGVQDTGKNQN